MDLESAPADDGAGQAGEGFVDIVTDLPADAQPPEPVQQRDGLFHHVPVDTKARAVRGAPAGDGRADAPGLDLGARAFPAARRTGRAPQRSAPGARAAKAAILPALQ